MKIVSIIGARPQFVKAAAVSRAIRAGSGINEIIVHTGQHYDRNMSEIFFTELDIPEPDYNLGVGSGSHAGQTGSMLKGIEDILLSEKPGMTLVYGDTNSTLAGALASVKIHIPVAHVEAGLRSFNRNMPEEINRIVTDRIGNLLLAPTMTAVENLQKEGLGPITRFTGDVMYDSVLFYRDKIEADRERYTTPGLPGEYLLATIHRAENTDHPENLSQILKAFGQLDLPVVLPVHPRTAAILKNGMQVPPSVRIIEPVGYLHMLRLVMDAQKVLTDSGGLQKEAYFLAKPCVTIRTETEWVETLHDGWNIITGTNPERIVTAVQNPMPVTPRKNSFGDGNAANATVRALLEFVI